MYVPSVSTHWQVCQLVSRRSASAITVIFTPRSHHYSRYFSRTTNIFLPRLSIWNSQSNWKGTRGGVCNLMKSCAFQAKHQKASVKVVVVCPRIGMFTTHASIIVAPHSSVELDARERFLADYQSLHLASFGPLSDKQCDSNVIFD